MPLKINYKLGDYGWADVAISMDRRYIGRRSLTMAASYLHDSLGDLVIAANLLANGEKEAKVLFMDEPGEHLMLLTSSDNVNLEIEIRWFKDWASWNFTTEKEYEVAFSATDNVLNFSQEVFKNAKKILSSNGLDGYKEKWIEHDFPINEFNALEGFLENAKNHTGMA
jgi:hypothetical protein